MAKLFLAVLVVMMAAYQGLVRPSNSREWTEDQKILPSVSIEGYRIRIQNVRRFRYRTVSDYVPGYADKELDLRRLQRVWYAVEPLSTDWKGLAHTLLSFEFSDGEFVVVSVEIRKEKGESYSPLKGLFRRFELMYVIADEEDAILLRTNHRQHDVYLYPIETTPARAQALFVDMMRRAQQLETKPEFYNTITNTCTTNIVRHIRRLVPDRIPHSIKILLPGYSDRLAYDEKLIDHSASFEEVRKRHWISGRARRYTGTGHFSQWIRETQ